MVVFHNVCADNIKFVNHGKNLRLLLTILASKTISTSVVEIFHESLMHLPQGVLDASNIHEIELDSPTIDDIDQWMTLE